MPKKLCAHCRLGEVELEADVRVRGKDREGRFRPNWLLCVDHLAMEREDGAELEVTETLLS